VAVKIISPAASRAKAQSLSSMQSSKNRNKKGFVFTMMAIFFVIVAMTASILFSKYTERSQAISIESRVFTINNFIHDLERDMSRALYIASFRALLGMTSYMSENGTYITNLSANFAELVLNGTIYNQTTEPTNDSYVTLWLAKVQQEAQDIGVTIDAYNYSLSLVQRETWNLEIEMNLTLVVQDAAGLATWTKDDTIRTTIPITGLEDPLYTVGSDGLISNIIIQTPFEFFVNQTTSNVSNLQQHAINSYYIEDTDAPSYVMRLQGLFSSSSFGIESTVYSLSLVPLGQYKNKSVVDHIYWSTSNPAHNAIQGMPSWYRLDNLTGHFDSYEVSDLVIN